MIGNRRPDADDRDRHQHADQAGAAVTARGFLNAALGFEDQPARTEQSVTEQQRDARHDRERRQEVERMA